MEVRWGLQTSALPPLTLLHTALEKRAAPVVSCYACIDLCPGEPTWPHSAIERRRTGAASAKRSAQKDQPGLCLSPAPWGSYS